jgi:predicted transglutaminase-like protease
VDFRNCGEYKRIAGNLTTELPEIDAEGLTAGVTNILGIEQVLHRAEPDFEIPLRNLANYYMDNDIIQYSLIRAIKNDIESELCGNMQKTSTDVENKVSNA